MQEIYPPITVWICPADSVIGGPVEARQMSRYSAKKIEYSEVDQYGYVGAKLDFVFFTKEQAEEKASADKDVVL